MYIINDLPDDIICNIAIYADDNTIFSISDQAFDMLQQVELVSGEGSGLWILFNVGKTQFVWFDQSDNFGAINSINVRMDGSVFKKIIFLDAGTVFLF